jgi:hypothetical protein
MFVHYKFDLGPVGRAIGQQFQAVPHRFIAVFDLRPHVYDALK